MARYKCTVKRMEGELVDIDSSELVPGDIIEVISDAHLPCDLILLDGSVIVNESMLTGESIPVMKSSLPLIINDKESMEKHTLYGGTRVVQTRSER